MIDNIINSFESLFHVQNWNLYNFLLFGFLNFLINFQFTDWLNWAFAWVLVLVTDHPFFPLDGHIFFLYLSTKLRRNLKNWQIHNGAIYVIHALENRTYLRIFLNIKFLENLIIHLIPLCWLNINTKILNTSVNILTN